MPYTNPWQYPWQYLENQGNTPAEKNAAHARVLGAVQWICEHFIAQPVQETSLLRRQGCLAQLRSRPYDVCLTVPTTLGKTLLMPAGMTLLYDLSICLATSKRKWRLFLAQASHMCLWPTNKCFLGE